MSTFINKNGVQSGPFSDEQILAAINQGSISAEDLCWREGWDGWKKIGSVYPIKNLSKSQIPDSTKNKAKDSFISILLEASFNRFLSLKIFRWIYLIYLWIIVPSFLICLYLGFTGGSSSGNHNSFPSFVYFLIGFGLLLFLIVMRIFLESMSASFKIAENTSKILELLEKRL
jgi:hypothetical protein